MSRRHALWVPLTILILGTVLAWVFPIDQYLAQHLYFGAQEAWALGSVEPMHFAYKYGEKLCFAIPALWAIVVLAASLRMERMRRWRRAALFTLAMLAIGPGIIVNSVLKEHTGRPRPRQVEQFGGEYAYRRPLEFKPANEGCYSFPSGHVAVAFSLMFPYFFMPQERRRAARLWLFAGVLAGLFMGFARMAQGAHWASDVLWSFGVVYFSGYLLSKFIRPEVPNGDF